MFRANARRTGIYNSTGLRRLRGIKWKYPKDSAIDFSNSALELSDGVLYLGSKNGYIYAVDSQRGQELWKLKLGVEPLSYLVISQETLYVGTLDGYIWAIDIRTKQEKWKFKIENFEKDFFIEPIVVNNVICLNNKNGNLYAIETETGTILWQFKTTKYMATLAPIFADNIVYVASENGNLYAVDCLTGEEQWKCDIGSISFSSFNWSIPVLSDNTIYIPIEKTGLRAIDISTGEIIWQLKQEDRNITPLCSPIIINGIAYTIEVGFGTLYAINVQTGEIIWQKSVKGFFQIAGNLIGANNTLYYYCVGGIFAIDLPSGEILWEFVAPDPDLWIFKPNLWGFQLMNSAKKIITGTSLVTFSPPIISDRNIYVSYSFGDFAGGYLVALH